MDAPIPLAPLAVDHPLAEGTRVSIDPRADFLDREHVSGGTPWRLLRLSGASRAVAEQWRTGGVVRAGESRLARTLVSQGLLHPHFSGDVDVNEIDVVVPVHDDAHLLAALLDELSEFHVTVVDDGSSDASWDARYATRANVDVRRLDDNRGPAHARNHGARVTSREFLWFIDADVTLGDARAVAERLRNALRDPLVAACAPRIRGAGGASWRERFEERFSPLDLGPRSSLVAPVSAVSFVPGACVLVRRSAYGDGFDESMRVGEDVDFVWRLVDRGWLVRYDAEVAVGHRTRASWRAWWLQRHRYGASSADLAARHGRRLAPVRADLWTVVGWGLVATGHPIGATRVVRAARDHARERLFGGADNPEALAQAVVTRQVLNAGGPLARSVVRTFGTGLLAAALHPRLRKGAVAIFVVGTAWRWRHERPRLGDVPLAVADDLAYGTGVWRGAWKAKSLTSLTPHITKPSMSLRDVLGLSRPRAGVRDDAE